jgi:fatty acid synthase subunit alpha, fungi type
MEVALETILFSKAKVMVVDGFDDLWEEGFYEFNNMKATSNSEPGTELAMDHESMEMSWPMTTTHAGCVLSSLLSNCHSLI